MGFVIPLTRNRGIPLPPGSSCSLCPRRGGEAGVGGAGSRGSAVSSRNGRSGTRGPPVPAASLLPGESGAGAHGAAP